MASGAKISFVVGKLVVPDNPIIPYIEGDGIGPDIWRAAVRVLEHAIGLCWPKKRRIAWKEVLAGKKAFDETGEWLPQETLDTFQDYRIGIKGPLTTPVGEGIRSLNVALQGHIEASDPLADGRGEGPFDTDPVVLEGIEGFLGKPLSGLIKGLLAGKDLFPGDPAFFRPTQANGVFKDPDGRPPYVGPYTIPLDIGDNRIVGNNELPYHKRNFCS